mgnify:CR=1 FL=1
MKRGDNGEAGKKKVFFVGVRERVDLGAVGDDAWSKIDSGEAGRSGDALGESIRAFVANWCGGMRNGFIGDFGVGGDAILANGEAVSGSQYDNGGTRGTSSSRLAILDVDG